MNANIIIILRSLNRKNIWEGSEHNTKNDLEKITMEFITRQIPKFYDCFMSPDFPISYNCTYIRIYCKCRWKVGLIKIMKQAIVAQYRY